MREIQFTLIGLLVASFIPPLLLSLISPLSGAYELGSIAEESLVLFPFSGVFVMLLGFPTFLLLRRFAPGHWWSVFAAGFLLGSVAASIVAAGLQPKATLAWGVIGGITAVVFWLIWLQGKKGLAD